MNYDDINKAVDEYNWDDGFEFPSEVLENELCDLALALKIFYLGDGYGYFQKLKEFNEMYLTTSDDGDIKLKMRELLFNHLED